jgi:gamma-glutamyltranspeptidase/glutathione hydrolase
MDQPTNQLYAVRRAVAGTSRMVSAGHHLATLAGTEMFRRGGNAIDAAVAAGAVSTVVLPHACGLGGDCFAVGYDPEKAASWALNGSGKSPSLVSLGSFSRQIPEQGVAAATVPGIVHGWSSLLKRYGKLTMPEVLAPAIAHAENGFVVNDILAKLIVDNSAKLKAHPYSAQTLLPSGRPIAKGEVLRQPLLARTLRQISSGGAEEFYAGAPAKEICRYVEEAGGFLRPADFLNHSSLWENPASAVYDGYEVLVPPPNSLSILLLLQLKLLSASHLKGIVHNSAEYVQQLVHAKRLAFQNVLPMLSDPETLGLPVADLLSQNFIDQLSRTPLRSRNREFREISDTTSIVAADDDGNCISLIQSVFFHFGSGVIAGESGAFLNNRMTGFTLNPHQPNALAKNKRPAHTLSPAMVLKENKPFLVISTPGAYGQTQSLCQVLNNILLFGMEPQVAVELPRWFDELEESLIVENRIGPEVLDSLMSKGYSLQVRGPWEAITGSIQCILIDQEKAGVLYGAADPRRMGVALGW